MRAPSSTPAPLASLLTAVAVFAPVLCAGSFLAGCARHAAVERAPGVAVDLPPRVEESSLPPEELEAIPEPGAPGSPVGSRGAGAMVPGMAAPPVMAPPGEASAASVPGYRVQIFASPDRASAETVAARARRAFRDPVYVEDEPPLYKVRVGDFLTRDEAGRTRDDAVASAYPDAWIVAARVNRRGGGGR